ncbi:MAG TPA: hypothetical protein VHB99_16785 [Pirellulales bacterium]|nr:hypothetical protein [Pirellulales bacterium]
MPFATVIIAQIASGAAAWIGGALCLLGALALGWALLVYGGLWFQGYMSGARIGLPALPALAKALLLRSARPTTRWP